MFFIFSKSVQIIIYNMFNTLNLLHFYVLAMHWYEENHSAIKRIWYLRSLKKEHSVFVMDMVVCLVFMVNLLHNMFYSCAVYLECNGGGTTHVCSIASLCWYACLRSNIFWIQLIVLDLYHIRSSMIGSIVKLVNQWIKISAAV